MWPDLSYILHSIFGIEPDGAFSVIKTFGLFLGIAFLCSGYLCYLEIKRKEERGLFHGMMEEQIVYKPINWQDIFLQVFINFILAFKLAYIVSHFEDFKRDGAAVLFSAKGHVPAGLVVAIITLVVYVYKMNKQQDTEIKKVQVFVHPHQRIVDITIHAAIYGIIGSKLFSVLENFNSFLKDPIGEFFSGSGLTIYGGLILAFIMVTRYVSKKGMRPIHLMDAASPAVMIGYCVGRMGCHFSGDGDWGIVNELAKPDWFFLPDYWWSYGYPHNVLNEGIPIESCRWLYCSELSPKVFPTPLYEIFLAGFITALLWFLRLRIFRAGVLFFIYCILNGLERFFIEFIRVNPRYTLFSFELSQAQFIALGLILTGIIGTGYYWKKNIPN